MHTPHATNTLPLPPRRRARPRRKYSLPGTEPPPLLPPPPPRHLLGPKPDRPDPDGSDKSDPSDPSLSERVSWPDLSATDSGVASGGSQARPHSLELSSPRSSTDSVLRAASSADSLPPPPPPPPPLPPPRSELAPKPARFRPAEEPPIPVIQVTEHDDEPTESATAKDLDDNLSLDDVFVENMEVDAPAEDEESLQEAPLTFMDEASPEPTVREAEAAICADPLDSDVESQRSVRMERSDTDSQVDIQSESSADTVLTAIQLRPRSPPDDPDYPDDPEDNMLVMNNPSYDSLNTYEFLSTDGELELLSTESQLSVIDESNPKLVKDFKNKMSKESSLKLPKNLADFFKSSASKLKPPCLEVKKELTAKKPKVDQEPVASVETSVKTPQRLIPRSPYIAPVPAFDKSPRKAAPTKQPPFYVWNINSKNAAVCTTLNPSCSYRPPANDGWKAFKDYENTTRRNWDITTRSNIAPPRTSPTKTVRDTRSASTGQLPTKPQRDAKMSLSQLKDLKLKTSYIRHYPTMARTKIISRPRPSPNRLMLPKRSPWEIYPLKGPPAKVKPSAKNPPKISIPLPSPNITVTKVKTQLPCAFTVSRTCENIAEACTVPESISLPNVTVPIELDTKKSWVKKWKSVINELFQKQHKEFCVNGTPPDYNIKRSNTWPPKTKVYADSSIYMRFK